ncbi:MAG: PIG-L family deacetylase [Hydrogenophilaceae bacterium]|nr:PIG-L family deacetylase [Hydrogenophilaceae bacterium]
MKVLVVAAHPDDEVLGCGGTIARHSDQGDEVAIVILAEGATSRASQRDRTAMSADLDRLGSAAQRAGAILGASVTLHDFPDNRMDSVDLLDVVKRIEAVIETFRPDTVYTHHAGDVNIDHRIVHQAVVTACRPMPGQCVRTLLFFEVASSTEWQPPGTAPAFQPNWFVPIETTLGRKIQALQAYAEEMRAFPHARSVEAVEHLARWRGAGVGAAAAEAFMLGRRLTE